MRGLGLLRFIECYGPEKKEGVLLVHGWLFSLLRDYLGINDVLFAELIFYIQKATNESVKLNFLEDVDVVAMIHAEDERDLDDRVLAEIKIKDNFESKLVELELLYSDTCPVNRIIVTPKNLKRVQGGHMLGTERLGPIHFRLIKELNNTKKGILGEKLGDLISENSQDTENTAKRSVSNITSEGVKHLKLPAQKPLIINARDDEGYFLNYVDYDFEIVE